MADLWVRPELKESNDLITPSEFGHAHGMETTAMASRLRRYADKAPQVARIVNARTRYYVRGELEVFLAETSSTSPRTAKEVAYAEVVYLEQAIAEGEAGLKNHDAAVATSEENLRRATEALAKKKEARSKARSFLNRRRKELEIARAKMNLAD